MERYGEKDIARQDTGHNCIPNIVKKLKRRVILLDMLHLRLWNVHCLAKTYKKL